MAEISLERIGLRSYDVAIGFRNLNESSGLISEFHHTHMTGMAAVLAGAIRGRDVIADARKLRVIAAEVLGISPYAFEPLVRELDELELVRGLQYRYGELISFNEQIPLFYDGLHERLGAGWTNKSTTELEQQLILGVDALSRTPILAEELYESLGVDSSAEPRLRAVAEGAELAHCLGLRGGDELVTTPLYAFERPEALNNLLEGAAPEEVILAFERIRLRPGYAISPNDDDPIAEAMIRLGLVQAPTVKGADDQDRSFIVIPYGLDPEYLTAKKQVLDRALALIACVRCGEISGGVAPIRFPDRLLARLLDPTRDHKLGGHSSTQRQYAPLIRMGVLRAIPKGNYYAAQLIPTTDNLEAVGLARALLARSGEGVPDRGNEHKASQLLFTGNAYLAPIETIHTSRARPAQLSNERLQELWMQVTGWDL